jgi:hypothetical protein
MRDGFLVGRARDGLFAGLFPAVDGGLRQAGGFGVLGQDFGWRIVALLEDLEQPSMKCLASGLQQALIGRVADQRVLEQVVGLRSCAAAEDQLGLDKSSYGRGKLSFRQGRQGGDRAVVKGAADHRRGLRNLLHRFQSVEAGHQ